MRGNGKIAAFSGGKGSPTGLETFLQRTTAFSPNKQEEPGRKNTTIEAELESAIQDDPDFTIDSPKAMKMSEKAFNKTFEQFQYMYHNVTKKPKQYDEEKIAASLQLIFDLQEKEELKRLEKKNNTTTDNTKVSSSSSSSSLSGSGHNGPKK